MQYTRCVCKCHKDKVQDGAGLFKPEGAQAHSKGCSSVQCVGAPVYPACVTGRGGGGHQSWWGVEVQMMQGQGAGGHKTSVNIPSAGSLWPPLVELYFINSPDGAFDVLDAGETFV